MPSRRVTRFIGGAVLLVLTAGTRSVIADEVRSAGWREDFHIAPKGWELRRKPGAKMAEFHVEPQTAEHDGALFMTADKASGMFATHLGQVDLHRTPILRWRWRAITLPTGGDGRMRERDDQAIGIYVSTGGPLRQKSVAYRWETDTPVGTEGDSSYAAGIVKAKWFALRNAKEVGSFFVEERNVARDFQRAFGFVPDDVSIGVTCNSQYTGTTAAAELDWIELVAEPAAGTAEEQ
jgi:hypothetical protein